MRSYSTDRGHDLREFCKYGCQAKGWEWHRLPTLEQTNKHHYYSITGLNHINNIISQTQLPQWDEIYPKRCKTKLFLVTNFIDYYIVLSSCSHDKAATTLQVDSQLKKDEFTCHEKFGMMSKINYLDRYLKSKIQKIVINQCLTPK